MTRTDGGQKLQWNVSPSTQLPDRAAEATECVISLSMLSYMSALTERSNPIIMRRTKGWSVLSVAFCHVLSCYLPHKIAACAA
ncbi:MAG: hypothetical protein Alpg2KO_26010 [Alphaproteobacteria bacterium]